MTLIEAEVICRRIGMINTIVLAIMLYANSAVWNTPHEKEKTVDQHME